MRGLAAPGEAGEEDHEAALVVAGLVLLDHGRDLGGPVAFAGDRQDLAGRVVGRHLATQLVVVVRVAVGGERCGDDVGRRSASALSRSAATRVARTRPTGETPCGVPVPFRASSTTVVGRRWP